MSQIIMPLLYEIALGLLITLAIALWLATRRAFNNNSLTDLVWAGKQATSVQGGSLISSTAFAMNGILYFLWLGYLIGWWALFLQLFWSASYVMLSLRAEVVSSRAKFSTLHGAIGSIFGPGAARLAAIASVGGFVMTFGWELSIGVSLFSGLGTEHALNSHVAMVLMLIIGIICAVYTSQGGLSGNIRANTFLNALGAAMLIVLFGWFFFKPAAPVLVEGKSLFEGLGLVAVLSNIVFSIFWQYVDMSTWQDIIATRNRRARRRALWGSAVFVFLFPGVCGTAIGIFLRTVVDVNADNIIFKTFELLSANPILAIFVAAGCFAAMLSTLDDLLLASGQSLIWDLLYPKTVSSLFSAKESGEVDAALEQREKVLVSLVRVSVLVVALVGAIVSSILVYVLDVNLFDLIYVSFSAQLALTSVSFVVLYSKERTTLTGGLTSIALGLVSSIAIVGFAISSGQADLIPLGPILSVAFSVVGLILGSQTSKGTTWVRSVLRRRAPE